jgi:hypothetical protein
MAVKRASGTEGRDARALERRGITLGDAMATNTKRWMMPR